MKSKSKEKRFHKRHVTVETPCRLHEIDNIIRSIGDLGFWDSAKIMTDGDNIVITYGNKGDTENECSD